MSIGFLSRKEPITLSTNGRLKDIKKTLVNMKFNIQCVRGNQARLGVLTEVGRNGNTTLETPLCLLYTKGGSAPFMSFELLKKLQDVPKMAHLPLNQFAQHQVTIAGFKEGITKFAALDDQLVFTTSNDPAMEVPAGYNTKSGIGLWGKGGKTQLDCDGYLRLLEAMQPDWFQCMSDGDTDNTTTSKRAGKTVERTLKFLDYFLEKMKCSKELKNSVLFGSIVGGYDRRARELCIRETVARNVEGFVIEGFHRHGPSAEHFDVKENSDLLSSITKLLPEDKPRLMHSVWRPDSVLAAVELGIDVFDSSYPFIITERGHAMVFNFDYKPNPEKDDNDVEILNGFTIDLNDKIYADKFSPLLENCECYTCKHFTQAYINHLLNTTELLASTLLMLHNFHHYFQYFKTIREALAQDRFEQLKTLIVQQAQISISKE